MVSQYKKDDFKSSQNSYVFGTSLSKVQDFRINRRMKFDLTEVIQVAVCAVLSGADNWNEIECFARAKELWFKKFLKLKSGIPSHDTFRRVFSELAPQELEQIFEVWVMAQVNFNMHQQIAIDGKSLRGSHDGKTDPVHIVSAFLPDSNLVLAQERVPKKQKELEAIYRLLNRLPVAGHPITIDALGCQANVVASIVAAKAKYLLALNRNQIATYDEASAVFLKLPPQTGRAWDIEDKFDESHGRTVRRTTRVIRNLRWFKAKERWPDLGSLIQVESIRKIRRTNIVAHERRFFISNLKATATEFQKMIRCHWGVENNLHWALDVSFKEDQSRIRFKNSAENFSLLRRLSLNLIRIQADASSGILSARRRAGWDEKFLEDLVLRWMPTHLTTESLMGSLKVSDLFLSPASYKEWSESIL